MLPYFRERYANAGSVTHEFGRSVAVDVEAAVSRTAQLIGATPDELVVTSGATESNNLALFGFGLHPRQKRRKIISLTTEHKAILDPLNRLQQLGFEVVLLPVQSQSSACAGQLDLQRLEDAIDDKTALVTVMLANNEIGTIQPISEISQLCHRHGCVMHTDASQAVGRIPVSVDQLDVDLLSFSAHKFYGPKGVGGLFVRRRGRRVRLQGQIVGGGQQQNMRSGTTNTAGVIGMQVALENTLLNLEGSTLHIRQMRDTLFEHLRDIAVLNGPPLSESRLPGNLNCSFYPIEGQSLMMLLPELAVSSGSACTSADPQPSHVLRALGLSEEIARSSLRFGIGRNNTPAEVKWAAAELITAARQLGKLLE